MLVRIAFVALAVALIHAPLAVAADPGTWQAADPMPTAVHSHSLTVLADGRVLVAGGATPAPAPTLSTTVATAAVWDPATGHWTAVPPLPSDRHGHTATRLLDGRVLVAGGWSTTGGYRSSCALFDPATDTWQATGSLIQARALHNAHRLGDGRVLVAGGESPAFQSSCEIYDPATGTWSATGAMPYHCEQAVTATVPGGVLIAGGYDGTGASGYRTDVAIFHPATGTWASRAAMATGRYAAGAWVLPDGRVLVGGGGGNGFTACELFDPVANTWAATGSLNDGRDHYAAVTTASGRIIAIGGSSVLTVATCEEFDPVAHTWSRIAGLGAGLAQPRAIALADDRILLAGGYHDSYAITAACATWTPAASTVAAITPSSSTAGTVVRVVISGTGFVASGGYPAGTREWAGRGYLLDPVARSWTAAGDRSEALGGSLATIDSAIENAFALDVGSGNPDDGYWIGLSDLVDGTWRWQDGVAASYLRWAPSEPNNPATEHGVQVYTAYGLDGYWNNLPVGATRPAVCEFHGAGAVAPTVRLLGPATIAPTTSVLLSPTTVVCTFDLTAAAGGTYDVAVGPAVLAAAFVVVGPPPPPPPPPPSSSGTTDHGTLITAGVPPSRRCGGGAGVALIAAGASFVAKRVRGARSKTAPR